MKQYKSQKKFGGDWIQPKKEKISLSPAYDVCLPIDMDIREIFNWCEACNIDATLLGAQRNVSYPKNNLVNYSYTRVFRIRKDTDRALFMMQFDAQVVSYPEQNDQIR